MAFLKNKGLLEDESKLRGGAGAASVTGSPNSNAQTPRRTLVSRTLSSRISKFEGTHG